jgi:hypothetical protein
MIMLFIYFNFNYKTADNDIHTESVASALESSKHAIDVLKENRSVLLIVNK